MKTLLLVVAGLLVLQIVLQLVASYCGYRARRDHWDAFSEWSREHGYDLDDEDQYRTALANYCSHCRISIWLRRET